VAECAAGRSSPPRYGQPKTTPTTGATEASSWHPLAIRHCEARGRRRLGRPRRPSRLWGHNCGDWGRRRHFPTDKDAATDDSTHLLDETVSVAGLESSGGAVAEFSDLPPSFHGCLSICCQLVLLISGPIEPAWKDRESVAQYVFVQLITITVVFRRRVTLSMGLRGLELPRWTQQLSPVRRLCHTEAPVVAAVRRSAASVEAAPPVTYQSLVFRRRRRRVASVNRYSASRVLREA